MFSPQQSIEIYCVQNINTYVFMIKVMNGNINDSNMF